VAQARAERAATLAEIEATRDRISNQVWAAYSNLKTAERQQQAAAALLAAANESYAAARESYSYGVRNLLDVIAAQKALAQAASEDVSARAQLLLQSANLAFQTGDLIYLPPGKTGP
jgi:outer membrane protein TolC